jgi:hypothetical protein
MPKGGDRRECEGTWWIGSPAYSMPEPRRNSGSDADGLQLRQDKRNEEGRTPMDLADIPLFGGDADDHDEAPFDLEASFEYV